MAIPIEFYEKYSERLMLMPAAHKKEYHNAFPGGYVEHVNRVITCALHLHDLWASMGADTTTYTKEELVFSALNHDLGKMGSEEEEAYVPQTDNWRKEKLPYLIKDTMITRPLMSLPRMEFSLLHA